MSPFSIYIYSEKSKVVGAVHYLLLTLKNRKRSQKYLELLERSGSNLAIKRRGVMEEAACRREALISHSSFDFNFLVLYSINLLNNFFFK